MQIPHRTFRSFSAETQSKQKMGGSRGYSIRERQQNSCRAKASAMPVHFKNTTETVNAIMGKTVKRAMAYLKNVIARKECVPFRKFKGGVGRCGQAKQFKTTQVRRGRRHGQ